MHTQDLWSLDALSRELWSNSDWSAQNATILLLRLTTSARSEPDVAPLVPHRLHCLVRAPEGLSVCINPACTAPPETLANKVGALQTYRDRCSYCDAVTLPIVRCTSCGIWALTGYEDIHSGHMDSGFLASASKRRYYLVTTSPDRSLSTVVVNPQTGEWFNQHNGTLLYRAPCPEHGTDCNDPSSCTRQQCPHCGCDWSSSSEDDDDDQRAMKAQPLLGGERLAVGVLAETVLHGMPVYPDGTRDWKPAQGRRLLCFSDSRREAARLGPLLSRQHEVQLIRAAIADTVRKAAPPTTEYFTRQIHRCEDDIAELSLFEQDRREAAKKCEEWKLKLSYTSQGLPIGLFTEYLAQDTRIG